MRTHSPLALTICLMGLASSATAALPRVGDLHPDFKTRDAVTGEEFSLSALRGQVVLLKYWATW